MLFIDEWVLERLTAVMGDPDLVHDGLVTLERPGPGEPVVVRYPMPYVVYASNLGDTSNARLAKRHRRHSTFWSLMVVGLDRTQVKAALEDIRADLHHTRPAIAGYKFWPVSLEESQRVRRDDDAINVDGSPLFYGVDNYAVAHQLKSVA